MSDCTAKPYMIEDGSGNFHTFLHLPTKVDVCDQTIGEDIFNIIMLDVSGSMSRYSVPLVEFWNTHIFKNLNG